MLVIRSLKIFCPVWGSKHQDLFKRALLKSLSWSKNKPLIEGASWLITSDSEESAEEAIGSITDVFTSARTRKFIYPELSNPNTDRGQILIKSVQQSVEICLQSSSPLLMATPDFIYGNGTIEAFAKIADEPGSCATIANIRVLPDILSVLDDAKDANEDLVLLARSRLHKSWSESPKNLYRSGVKVKELPGNLLAVEHFMPSPFYVNFLDCDKQHFKEWHERKPPGFGCWDHTWTSHLLDEHRIKFIGSSDAAVMIEVTDEDKNVPPINDSEESKNKFFRNHFHNHILSQFVTIFRA